MARLIFRSGPYNGRGLTLPAGKTIVMGRNRDVDLPLPDPKLSRKHCQITFDGQQVLLADLNSTNGTFVNGARLNGTLALHAFDRVVLGDLELELIDFDDMQRLNAAAGAANTPISTPAVAHPAEAPAKAAKPAKPVPPVPVPPPANPFDLAEEILPEAPSTDVSAMIARAPVVEINIDEQAAPAASGSPARLPDSAGSGPFEAALRELAQPLPPEPTPAGKPQVYFCDTCNSSIPMLDYELGIARLRGRHLLCKECLNNAPATIEPARTAPAGSGIKTAHSPVTSSGDLAGMLAGLDEEAVVIDTTLKRGGHVMEDGDISKQLQRIEQVQKNAFGSKPWPPTTETQRIIPPSPPPPHHAKNDDDLEEIG